MLDWYGARCKDVADVINENAPGNCQLTSPDIQKDIVQACNPYAFYVHCFAHQLQLVVVAVVKGFLPVGQFFGHLNKIVSMVSASCRKSVWTIFLLITCDFLPQKNLELICSTRLNSIPGSATDTNPRTEVRLRVS
jgi:hypothetical protein